MRFHVVLFGNRHEIWSKQHNGKVSVFVFYRAWNEQFAARLIFGLSRLFAHSSAWLVFQSWGVCHAWKAMSIRGSYRHKGARRRDGSTKSKYGSAITLPITTAETSALTALLLVLPSSSITYPEFPIMSVYRQEKEVPSCIQPSGCLQHLERKSFSGM
jgi:hypothetical protein